MKESGLKKIARWDVIAVVFLSTFLVLCDAERDNPYDPKSPSYKPGGEVTGYVKTRTGVPVEMAEVIVEPDRIFTYSGADGSYQIRGVVTESTHVRALKPGFSSEDTTLKVSLGKATTADFYLDILPVFVSCRVIALHKSNTRYYALFEAEVFDGDGTGWEDIDNVSFFIKGYPENYYLKFYEPTGTYRKELDASYFEEDSLRGLIGKDCFFMVRDKAYEMVISEPCRAVRIIDKQPKTIKPSGWERVGSTPTLSWENFGESFHYTYKVSVRDINNEVVYPLSKISSDSLSAKVQSVLLPGEYSWTVSVVDEFGNESESISATFVVE